MKFQAGVADTIGDIKRSAFKMAMNRLGITEQEKLIDSPEEFNNVRQEAGRILAEQMLGRPEPLKKHPDMIRANMAVMKMGRKEQVPAYPRTADTDNKKFIYLSDLFLEDNITKEIFIDLAEILNHKVSRKIKRILKVKAQSDIGKVELIDNLFDNLEVTF